MSSHVSGQLIESGLRNSQDTARAAGVRDLSVFIGTEHFRGINGTWTFTRDAAGLYKMRRTAAAANHNPGYALIITPNMLVSTETADVQQVEAARGPRINSLELIYEIATEAIDAHVATLTTSVFANEVAEAATNRPITGTLLLTTNANPRVTTLTVTTPFILADNTVMSLEVRVDDTTGGLAVVDFWGCMVNYDVLL